MSDTNTVKTDDFVTKEQYEKSLTSEDYVKFSQTFNANETQKLIQESINKLILQSITCDHATRTETKKLIKELEKEELWASLRKFGLLIYTALTIFGAAALTLLVQHFSK
jgi:hypothetical protein